MSNAKKIFGKKLSFLGVFIEYEKLSNNNRRREKKYLGDA